MLKKDAIVSLASNTALDDKRDKECPPRPGLAQYSLIHLTIALTTVSGFG